MKLLCNLNLFALEQTIYSINEFGESQQIAATEMEQLPATLSAIYNELSAEKIILIGLKSYANPIAQQIKQFAAMHYKNNNIEIEVV